MYEADPSVDPGSLVGPIEDSRAVFAKMVDRLKEAEVEAE